MATSKGKKAARNKWIAFGSVALVIGVTAYAFYALRQPPPPAGPVAQRDPLCEFVGSKQLRCVAFLGADSLLGPGAIVDYSANAPPEAPVPLPVAALFSTACLVPGEHGEQLLAATKVQNMVALPGFTYKFDRNMEIGAALAIPRISGLDMKAGPSISQLRDMTLKVGSAWVQMMDQNLFLEALEHAGIKSSCVDRLLEQSYQIVATALIGKGLDYSLTDTANQTFSAKVAADKGLISFGAGAGLNEKVAAMLANQDPLVMGVTFLSSELLKNRTKLKEAVVWSATGQTHVTASGGGGLRHITKDEAMGALGQQARLQVVGSEESQCNASYEVTRSSATAEVGLLAIDSQTLAFVADLRARGGHYATAARCALGQLIGITGHDNSATITATASGTIRATIRVERPHVLTLEAQDLPDQTTASVQAPNGSLIPAENQTATTVRIRNGQPVRFQLPGAGVYIINTLMNVQVVGQGAQTGSYQRRGTLKASAESIRIQT